jgi:hypothetical protein
VRFIIRVYFVTCLVAVLLAALAIWAISAVVPNSFLDP